MSMIERSFSEKRNFIRMKINAPVTLHTEGHSYQGICKDLSGAGMQIETSEAFSVGDIMQVTIEQKGASLVPFKATVEVSRIEPSTSGGHIVGFAIKEIEE